MSEYDLFLSHASEDTAWCETLAERLRNEGVRVWFDRWELQPGDHLLARINDGLKQSRKMVAVWSANYFRDNKVWTLAEGFSQQHPDVLARERPLIPLLIEDCNVSPLFRNILHIDFRNPDDFDLRFRQLLQALDLPRREFAREEEAEFREHELDVSRRGRLAQAKGKRFESEVATLYRLLGFEVKQDTELSGVQIDTMIQQKVGGLLMQAIVECKDKRITAAERDQILAQQNLAQKKLPAFRWIAVSSEGFAADTRTALEEAGVACVTYAELLRELVPLDNYVEGLISEYEAWVTENWKGEDWFIRPHLLSDITYEKRAALTHIPKWMGDSRSNFLVVLGDLGTGKTTLAHFLAYHLARSFRDDPLRHPAPVLIPLKEVRKELTLESMVISHFSRRGLPAISFPRFEHLVRLGKIIVLFDAFDEMADRVRWEVTRSNFNELRRAAEQNGKVILTCRTHYFKDRTEQVRVIGEGPRLSEVETALYKELRQQSGAEVVYLQEFDDDQIRAYLGKARPDTAEADWQDIQRIWNLKDLAHRPLLLDMIVKSLPQLKQQQGITAANLYTVFTNLWVDRDFRKGRVVLDNETRLALMMELAWRLWSEEKDAIHYKELVPFVEKLSAAHVLEFGDEEAEDIAREMQGASFLKRVDDAGHFAFMHRSFMEFFLARKIYDSLKVGRDCHSERSEESQPLNDEILRFAQNDNQARAFVLDTRRFDRKIIYFLTLLDETDAICAPLQQILTDGYLPNVSENALQILYWSGRIRGGMEETISDHDALRRDLAQRIPSAAQLAGANFQDIVLEAVVLNSANLSGADLTKANLNHAHLSDADLRRAALTDARAENLVALRVDFREADARGVSFSDASITDCDFTDAQCAPAQFTNATVQNVRGLRLPRTLRRESLQPVVQRVPASRIHTVAYHPKEDLLACGGDDGVIRLYRASDGTLLWTLEGHGATIWSITFDPSGQILASGSEDRTVKIWEVESGLLLRTLEGHSGAILSIAFDPKGRCIASGSGNGTVRIWEAESGYLLCSLEGHKSAVWSIAFNPQGQLIVSASGDRTAKIWEREGGQLLRILEGHNGVVWSVAFDPQGQRVASGSGDGMVKVWEAESGRLLGSLEGHGGHVLGVAFDPTGRTIASGSGDRIVKVWEAESGRLLRTLEGHGDSVRSVAFDPTGQTIASGSDDRTVKVWEASSGRLLRALEGRGGSVTGVAFDRSGQMIASGSRDRMVKVWEAQSGRLLRTLEGHGDSVWSVAFDPNGARLASGSDDNTVKVWEAESGRLLRTLEGHSGYVLSVAFDPTGQRLASGSEDRTVKMWEAQSGRLLCTLEGHRGPVWSVAFDPTGQRLASGSEDRTVKMWEAQSGRLLRRFDWSDYLLDNESEGTLEGHRGPVWSVAFDAPGARVASGSDDKTVNVWESESGRLLRTLEGHLGPVYAVAFAPNGKYLVAAGAAGRLQFWDVETWETFLYLYAFAPEVWLALLPDGRFDAHPEALRYLCYTEVALTPDPSPTLRERGGLNSYTAEELVKEFHDPQAVREVLAKYVS